MAYPAASSPGHDLVVRARRERGVRVVAISGQADLRTEHRLGPALRRALADPGGAVVLDLSHLTFCSTQALGVLADMASSMAHEGVRVAVVGLSHLGTRMWPLTGLPLPMRHTGVQQAVTALTRRSSARPAGVLQRTARTPPRLPERRSAEPGRGLRQRARHHPTYEKHAVAQELATALASLVDTADRDFSVEDMLRRLCVVAARVLDVDGAGVMVADGAGLRFIHADPQRLGPLERLQETFQQGPCRDSTVLRGVVAVTDIATSDQWPEYTAQAVKSRLGAVLAVPLLARDTPWGVLDLYKTGPWRWTEDEQATARALAGVATSYIVMGRDRDRARDAQRDLAGFATRDELTKLPNRALLFDRLDHAFAAAERHRTAVAALLVNLDRFKEVNDTLGRASGDQVLTEVGRRLRETIRENDTLARLAADEFVIVCEDLTEAPATVDRQMMALGERIGQALRRPPVHVGGVDIPVTASIGVAIGTGHPGGQDFIGDADQAMYVAKQRGGDRLVLSNRGTTPSPGSRRSLERELHHALARDELRQYYQPIVSAGPGNPVVAVEALLRWQHPRHGLLPAAAFIDLADRSGALGPIGKWTIDQACARLRDWIDTPGRVAPDQVFLNMSARQLAAPDLDGVLVAALQANDLPAARVGLEIVEDIFSDPLLVPRLQQHHDRGHPLAIDDFGTGYSSLARLVDLPATYAKIDRSIVAGIPQDQRRSRLVEAIMLVAHRLDLRVIAEGVETQGQADALVDAGCDLLQGLHLGHPRPGAEQPGVREPLRSG